MTSRPWIEARTNDESAPQGLAMAVASARLGPAMHWIGDPTLADRRPAVAVIGTRQPGEESLVLVDALTRAIARSGATIVSGAAEGTDMAAHHAAIEAGGRTIAALPGAIPHLHLETRAARLLDPSLHDRVLLVAPFATNQLPTRSTPVLRNRLIATLSDGVLVGEAPVGSGTWHCVRFAYDCGLPIFLLEPADGAGKELTNLLGGLYRRGARAVPRDLSQVSVWAAAISEAASHRPNEPRTSIPRQLNLFSDSEP